MGRLHVHVHLPKPKAKDALSGLSVQQLMKMVRNPGSNEGTAGDAIKELVKRGIDVRTGAYVGRAEAQQAASDYGDRSPS